MAMKYINSPPEHIGNVNLAVLERHLAARRAHSPRDKDVRKKHKAFRKERLARYADGSMAREGYGSFEE